MGAPVGNTNGAKSRLFHDALRKAITQDDGRRLRQSAEKLLDAAAEGEGWALMMLRDTLDGKPKQQTEVTGADGAPLVTSIAVEFARGIESKG